MQHHVFEDTFVIMYASPLYTIGHGTRSAEVFIGLLKEYDIHYLVDVRSRPYSRFNPQYNREQLKDFLAQHHITYVFMGDALGGRPQDASCYTADGRVDYTLVQQKPFFRKGIERLLTACSKGFSLAIMCSESKPVECHRMRMISPVLHAEGVKVIHIDEQGRAIPHTKLSQQAGATDLFSKERHPDKD